jgi:hypothetical protein
MRVETLHYSTVTMSGLQQGKGVTQILLHFLPCMHGGIECYSSSQTEQGLWEIKIKNPFPWQQTAPCDMGHRPCWQPNSNRVNLEQFDLVGTQVLVLARFQGSFKSTY